MEDDLNGRQPRWKITLMEDDLNEDDLNGRQAHGRRPQWKTTSMEDTLNERQHQKKTTLTKESLD